MNIFDKETLLQRWRTIESKWRELDLRSVKDSYNELYKSLFVDFLHVHWGQIHCLVSRNNIELLPIISIIMIYLFIHISRRSRSKIKLYFFLVSWPMSCIFVNEIAKFGQNCNKWGDNFELETCHYLVNCLDSFVRPSVTLES